MKTCLLVLCPILFWSGCATSQPAVPPGLPASRPLADAGQRHLVWRASLGLEVEDVSSTTDRVRGVVEGAQGYVESSHESETHRASMSLRVPEPSFDRVVEELSRFGRITHRRVGAVDVTGTLIDLEARVKNHLELRDRLRAMLAKTEEVERMLQIETELARVQEALDRMQGERKVLAGQVRLATIQLELERPSIPGPVGLVAKAVGWTLKKLFVLRA